MITSIRLQNFRSYQDATFNLANKVNIIVGPNASGKTNLLEAVLVVARGGSFRVKDPELVRYDAPWLRLDAQTDDHRRTIKVHAEPAPSKSYEIDSKSMARLHSRNVLPVVLFEPNHLQLLTGAPDQRRAFLDDLLEQSDPTHGLLRRHYKRVLSQRNALLKKNPPGLERQLFVWNIRLSELGGQIARQRHELTERLNASAGETYSTLAGEQTAVKLEYASRFSAQSYESQLLAKLEANPALEALRGFTAYGPHRDDLVAHINKRAVQESASRGETRTLVLTLKLLELQMVEQANQTTPLLLLDDVFSELDATRRRALTHYIKQYQTFITTTDADIVKSHFSGANIIRLEK